MAKYKKRYLDHEQFDEAVDKYVLDCEIKKEPLTISGLCLSLGFASRNSLDKYAQDPEFKESVARARLIIENSYEKNLTARGLSPVGSIFALKNVASWSDKQQVQVSADDDFFNQVFKITNENRKKETKGE